MSKHKVIRSIIITSFRLGGLILQPEVSMYHSNATMNNTITQENKRLDVVDSLRGFALLGIILIHNIDHFDLGNAVASESPLITFLDRVIREDIFFIFGGKSYAIFALLFGFSFFIQFKNNKERGKDFAGRFIWRMALLFGLGLFHVMFYSGEILSCYAVAALFLIPFRNSGNKVLLIMALICMLEPWELGKMIYALFDSSYVFKPWTHEYYIAAANAAKNSPSFIEVAQVNLYSGFINAHLFAWHSGRYFQTLSLFFIGMYLGRKELFRQTDKNKRFWLVTLCVSVLCFTLLHPMTANLSKLGFRAEIHEPLTVILTMWTNFSLMTVLVSLFVTAWFNTIGRKFQSILVPYGRMSLTNYITTSMIGSFIYYQYGLGLHSSAGVMWSLLIGIGIFTVQYFVSKWWLKKYKKGPFEWIWYKLTYIFQR